MYKNDMSFNIQDGVGDNALFVEDPHTKKRAETDTKIRKQIGDVCVFSMRICSLLSAGLPFKEV